MHDVSMINEPVSSIPPPAASSGGKYPRPQMVRRSWVDLCGPWGFAHDDDDAGRTHRWPESAEAFDRTIIVPFPPESGASGIGDKDFHPVVWYRRVVTRAELMNAGLGIQGERLRLHFGAVDYRADVWINGSYLGHHEGGNTPFSFDITPQVSGTAETFAVVVRAEDDPLDAAQPRGKQDWQAKPHGIWYERTTGIWQQVWLEAVPKLEVAGLTWIPDVPAGAVHLTVELGSRPRSSVQVEVELSYDNETLTRIQFDQAEPRSQTTITIPHQANGQAHEALLWSPENPRLIDARITVRASGQVIDSLSSYFGLRSVGWSDGHFMLNDRPYYIRAVLEQGYWPTSHLASPDADALREEVQLIKDFGFNSARIHEKVEDPRFLYWADRLGLLIWGENASAYEYSNTAASRTTREWLEVLRRDLSHPSIVVWVPLNESWGVQHIAHDPAQLSYAQGLYHLTKALDPTRLVITNDGWEHADSDMWTIHDYGVSREELAANYTDKSRVAELLSGIGPLGRRIRLLDCADRQQPVVVSEFGGVSYLTDSDVTAWGYATASDADEFEKLLRELFEGLQSSPVLAGFCYTQLTDTLQEANGLTDAHRKPKLPIEVIRSIVNGDHIQAAALKRPKAAVEKPHKTLAVQGQR